MNAVGVEKNDVRIEIIKKRRSDSVVEHTGKNIKTHNNNNPPPDPTMGTTVCAGTNDISSGPVAVVGGNGRWNDRRR